MNRVGWRRLLSACRFGRDLANRNLSFTEAFLSFAIREGYGDNDDDDPMVLLVMNSTSL